jgi:hypothetical protein
LYDQGLWVAFEPDALYFHPSSGQGLRLRRESVRKVVERHGYLIFRTRKLGVLIVPTASLENPGETELILKEFETVTE